MGRKARFSRPATRSSSTMSILKLAIWLGFAIVSITIYSRSLTGMQAVSQGSLTESLPRNLGIETPSFSLGKPFTTLENYFGFSRKDAGRFQPFSCYELLQQLKTNTCPVKDPNQGRTHARMTVTEPNFYISLHHEAFDKTRWGIMNTGAYYEHKLTKAFQDVLRDSPPDARVIDVGGKVTA